MERQMLPIGIQTLRKIREKGCYYVDKTPFALRLIQEGQAYFLSRPRRFGKSLFLDTLKELFEGNQALFTGLHAEANWDWSVKYPVVRLSFGSGVLKTPEHLAGTLDRQLGGLERQHGLEKISSDASSRLADLIEQLHERTGQRVVVLVDEYDKPILDNLTEPERAREMRDGLRGIYSVLKDTEAHLRFVFITGVSKFSKVSIFSGLNSLRDITLSPAYSAICGYTETDLDTVFAPELPGLDRDEVRRWYNGYNWLGEAVYNPFDLLLLFQERVFRPWWFETGTPSFLIEHLARRGFFTPNLAALKSSSALLSSSDIETLEPAALLWQAGYLTVHKVQERRVGQHLYILGYPNTEVELSLNEALLPAFGPPGQAVVETRDDLQRALDDGDLPGVRAAIHALFASIPHDWYRNNPLANYEGHYVSVFYSYVAALGYDVRVEDVTNKGNIDLALRADERVYLFEFKVVEQAPAEQAPAKPGAEGRALTQLRERGYAEKYRSPGVTVTLVGIEFGKAERNLVGFEVGEG